MISIPEEVAYAARDINTREAIFRIKEVDQMRYPTI